MLKLVPFPADQHRFFSQNIFDRDLEFLENRTKNTVPEFYQLLQDAKHNSKLRLILLSILSKDGNALSFQEKYQKRIAYELSEMMQHQDGYMLDYLLIHEDMANFLEIRNKIFCIGRGSSASSLVLFLLGLTKIDPLIYNLFFERWFSKNRTPDIDLDLGKEESNALKEYLSLKYGVFFKQVKVKMRWKIKQVFKEVLGRQGFNPSQTEGFIERIKDFERILPGLDEPEIIELMCQHDLQMKALMEYNPRVKQMVFEKLAEEKAIGNHAAGFVLSDIAEPFLEDIEKAGVVKIDLLTLEAYAEINRRYSVDKLKQLKFTPKGIENTLSREVDPSLMSGAKSFWKRGSFQKDFSENVLPRTIEGVATLMAVFRPGPLQLFFILKDASRYPQIEHILQETGGLFIFQEQMMQVLHELAGVSYYESIELLKFLSMKNTRLLKSFNEGKDIEEIKQKLGEDLFKYLEAVAPLLFNKSHALSYATIEYLLSN